MNAEEWRTRPRLQDQHKRERARRAIGDLWQTSFRQFGGEA